MMQLTIKAICEVQEEFMCQPERLEELFFAALGDADMFAELMALCKRRDIDAVPYINRAEAKYAEFCAKVNGPLQVVSVRKIRIPIQVFDPPGNPI